MKKIFLLLTVLGMVGGCTGPQGPPGYPGQDGVNIESEVFELKSIGFNYDSQIGYNIYTSLNPNIFDSDNILIYRLNDITNSGAPIWQLIPRTLFLPQGRELDYDYDFSSEDFVIYAGGNYDVSLTPEYLNNQTFRIVIIPGYFSSRKQSVDLNDYNAVIKAYGLDDTHVKVLNSK